MIGFRNFCTSSLCEIRRSRKTKNFVNPFRISEGKEKEDVVDGGYS